MHILLFFATHQFAEQTRLVTIVSRFQKGLNSIDSEDTDQAVFNLLLKHQPFFPFLGDLSIKPRSKTIGGGLSDF
jgi:hypothetical protein